MYKRKLLIFTLTAALITALVLPVGSALAGDGNNGNGIFVTQNSGVNLGNDRGDTIFDRPNTTTIENGLFGLKGTIGGYADGWLGTLDGVMGRVFFDLRSINSTRPWLW